MPSATVNFFTEEIKYTIKNKLLLKQWIKDAITNEGLKPGEISFIFCSDEYLHKINVEYLNHDTYTDIITFDNSEDENVIAGDIFISIDRIKENAKSFLVKEVDELHRVIIHGILHLCGYLDKKPVDKKRMTEKENEYLSKRSFV
ncbi:MAG: rRNA maturation RNase YbeY [Pseudosphingobacterium sp.]|uniref:Endoribonuclease YbeY n=1 Tax=Sphingobacterium sp. (strain 21) TaxID=743722 RepID=F4CEP1_SPHS2|nr:rRNA maturation RNase YbeY [Olivibacter sp. UJ_SKK_5.1]MDX3912153.1 rRNA maturation RNase YbeY [Pseudosphingobacterium sp.]